MIDLISLSNQTILSVVLTSNSEFKVSKLNPLELIYIYLYVTDI